MINIEYVDYVNYIKKLKEENPYKNYYRLIRFFEKGKISDLLNWVLKNNTLSINMKKDYFPNSIEIICNRDMSYNGDKECSIFDLLQWATYIFSLYKEQVNCYVALKGKYEKALFAERFDEASDILEAIEQKVCYSVWGVYQKFLILNLQGKQNESKKILYEIETKAINANFPSFLLFYYEKLTDSSIGFDEYVNTIHRLLESGDERNISWRYFDYKLNIVSNRDIQGVKSALIFDEQISFIDYYETYIDALQVLNNRKNTYSLVKDCIQSVYPVLKDIRIRNLFLALVDIDDDINFDSNICSIIEKYTCGMYSDLKTEFLQRKDNFLHDFTICKIFLKAGIDISQENVSYNKLWNEIYKIYTFKHEVENSLHIIGGYYKLFYGTSWRYKILGILVRKLNYNLNDDMLRLSLLNDSSLTPIFYQMIVDNRNKEKYLNLFKTITPATIQLHLYILRGYCDETIRDRIDPVRFKYYEIKQLASSNQYQESIDKCNKFLNTLQYKQCGLYYQERIRRTLYSCYIEINEYISAMNVYVDSYILVKELVVHMHLEKLINKFEMIAEDNEEVRSDICRPIVLRLYYKNLNDEVLPAYLDYLESQGCRNIINLLDKFEKLDSYDILFLNKVCTHSLLMKDYVSMSEIGVSAAELRANVLRTLLQFDLYGQKEYLSELNSIYKSSQLQKKIDSFNHNRIFIDKENLFKYLKDELTQEFSKFKAAQEIKKVLSLSKEKIEKLPFIFEEYWDKHKFFYGVIEKIKKSYLNDSPYSLEDFLSTRIRHNYCNDNLKKAFENEKLFSKKVKDSSVDYIVNEYWKNKLSVEEYNIVIEKLSKFSQTIDNKIQEIKEKWIRIKKNRSSEGLFDYCDFTSYFIDYIPLDYDEILNNVEEFYNIVISNLDAYTDGILVRIRENIDNQLKPYYNEAISKLEADIKALEFEPLMKREMLRKIEITKAKCIEDIEEFRDIFNMDNEKYPDFTMEELIEFCFKIEDDMNHEFYNANVNKVIKCNKKYKGRIFPYLVDIMAILIRNAVQHSKISKMEDLKIDLKVLPYKGSEMEEEISDDLLLQRPDSSYHKYSLIFNVINNLSPDVDEAKFSDKVGEIINNIYNGEFRKESIKEGGSGLYKVARTIYYSLNSTAVFYQKENEGFFDIGIAMDLNRFELLEDNA